MKSLQSICSIFVSSLMATTPLLAQNKTPQKKPAATAVPTPVKVEEQPQHTAPIPPPAKAAEPEVASHKTKGDLPPLLPPFLPWSLTGNGQVRPSFAAETLRPQNFTGLGIGFEWASLDAKAKDSGVHLKGDQQIVTADATQKLSDDWHTAIHAAHLDASFRGMPRGRQRSQHFAASLGFAHATSLKGFGLGLDFSVFGMERNESSLSDAKGHRIQSYAMMPSISYHEKNTFVVTGYSPGIRNEQDAMVLGRHGVLSTKVWQNVSHNHALLADVTYWQRENFYHHEQNYLELELGDTFWFNNESQLGFGYLWRQAQVSEAKQATPLTLGQERLSASWQMLTSQHRLLGAKIGMPLSLWQHQVDHRSLEFMFNVQDNW